MTSERDQTQFVTKLLIVLVVCIILTIYNSYYYDSFKIIRNRKNLYDVMQKDNLTLNGIYKISKPPKGFLVWSDNCHMPSMDPFESLYMSDFVPPKPPICSTKDPLIVKLFNNRTNEYILHIDMNLKDLYMLKSDKINCCYQQILRKGEKNYKYVYK